MKYITLSFLFFVVLLSGSQHAYAADIELNGWAWSSSVGWIKLNNEASDGGADYGVIAAGDNPPYSVSGYAWSSTSSSSSDQTGLGWIKFGNTRAECGGAANDPRLEVSGTGYRLVGAAQVVSLAPSAGVWTANSSNGNWNGCIYLNNASMPGSPTTPAFGVTFNPSGPNTYAASNSAYAWGAGAATANANCALAGLCFGGASWILFGGGFANVTLVEEDTPIVADLQISNWDASCENASNPVTLTWHTENAVQCKLTSNPDVISPNPYPITPVGDGSVTFNIPPTAGTTFTLTCDDADQNTTSATEVVSVECYECSDGVDNDSGNPIPSTPAGQSGAIDEDDVSCHADCNPASPYDPTFDSESYSCTTPTGNGTVIRKTPIPIEN